MASWTALIGPGLTVVKFLKDKFFPKYDGTVKDLREIDPKDFSVEKPRHITMSDIEYINTYIERPETKKIEDAILNRHSVLILGRPMQGKSREAFQILFKNKESLSDYTFYRPLGTNISRIPKKSNLIIFFDDLFKFAESNFDLFNFLYQFREKENIIIVTTCRTGMDYENVYNKYARELEQFDKIQLANITVTDAQHLSQITKISMQAFDGTPGSVILGLDRIKQILLTKMSDEQKAILKSLKLLSIIYIYFPSAKVIREICLTVFKSSVKNFDSDLTNLINTGLILNYKNKYRIWHDKYLEFVPLLFEQDDYIRLSEVRNILYKFNDFEGLINLSVWYGIHNYHDDVVETCNKAIEVNPNHAIAYYDRGTAYRKKSDYDRAIEDYTHAIRLTPKYSAAYNNRGLTYYDKGEYDLAIADFNEAIKLDPKDADVYNNRGNAYGKKGEYDLAIADFNESIKNNPKLIQAYNNRGNAFDAKREFDYAIADYNTALNLNPNFTEVFFNRGSTYASKKEYDLAIMDYTKAIALDPMFAQAYYNRIDIYLMKNEIDFALVDFNKLIEIYPKNADIFYERGGAYYNKHEYDLAIADLVKAINLDPTHAQAMAMLGMLFHKKGIKNEAKHWFNEALKHKDKLADWQENQLQQWLKEVKGN
jgi:tetratricopeptide (TPR) repeat protein